jgi:hypothetical protein
MSRNRLASAWGLLLLSGIAIAGACNAHVPVYALVDGGDEGGDDEGVSDTAPPKDAVGDAIESDADREAPEASAPLTYIRFALWSPDAPGADYCIAPRAPSTKDAGVAIEAGEAGDAGMVGEAGGSDDDSGVNPAWQGPLIALQATAVDGGIEVVFEAGVPTGLAFPQVSAYFAFPTGSYDIRAVPSGSADCATPLLGTDATGLPAFAAGAHTTVALVGDYAAIKPDPEMQYTSFSDDTSSGPSTIALRFIAAVPSQTALDLGVGTFGAPGFRGLFTGVPFGKAGNATDSDAGKVDDNGFLASPPVSDAVLTAIASPLPDGGTPLIVVGGVTIPAGGVATLIAVGGKTGGLPPLPELELCLDTAPVVDTVFANCNVLKTPGD